MTPAWTPHELAILRGNYRFGLGRCAELLPTRTGAAIRLRARLMGVTRAPGERWLAKQDNQLRKHYPDLKYLLACLPTRSRSAIITRARDLGLQKPKKQWTAAEIQRLRRLATTMTRQEIISAHPLRKPGDINTALWAHGIVPAKPRQVASGLPLLDDVRGRCRELDLTLKQVGEAVGSSWVLRIGSYKNSSAIRSEKFAEAVSYLGGELYAVWDD